MLAFLNGLLTEYGLWEPLFTFDPPMYVGVLLRSMYDIYLFLVFGSFFLENTGLVWFIFFHLNIINFIIGKKKSITGANLPRLKKTSLCALIEQ